MNVQDAAEARQAAGEPHYGMVRLDRDLIA
jgi:hypothetical protein